MLSRMIRRYWWRRFERRDATSWEELDRFPLLDPREQRRLLAERLLGQVQYFGTREDALPEWREAARIRDGEELWRLWPSLPILDKNTMRERFRPAEIQARFGIQGTVRATGGSTGEPTQVLHDDAMMRATKAASTYARLRMGWRPGMATVILWGSERDIGRRAGRRDRLYAGLMGDFVVDGYGLTRETVRRVLDLLRRHRPAALMGFTSMLEYVAREALAMNQAPPAGWVATAWNGGEMLFANQAELFQKAFGVPLLNRYGGRELSVMACQFEAGAPLHVFRPWLFVEVVDANGRPAAPGEAGRLLWTSTVCRGTPLLRYEVGDMASFAARDESEAGIHALDQLHGRTAGLLQLAGGRTINCLYWNHLFKEFPEVLQFQVVIQPDDSLRLLLKGAGFSGQREAQLRGKIAGFLGPAPFTLNWVEQIPLTARGKLLQVVRAG